MNDRLHAKLKHRKEEGTLRSLSSFEGLADFYSNDYLGLGKLKRTIVLNATGSGGSRLISGNSKEALDSEYFLAGYFESEAAIVFNSGYDANVGVLSSIPQRGDIVLYDESVHASARDGMRLSHAKCFSFKHNDCEDLSRKLQVHEGCVIYVVVESLYSMDGDICPLSQIANLCTEFNAYLIVDEAHSAGVYGKGLVVSEGIVSKIFARIVTFGKSYGCHGAAVLGEKELIEYLINFARSFIYTTALPPHSYKTIMENVQLAGLQEIEILRSKIAIFRDKIKNLNCKVPSDVTSPIQLIQIGNKLQTAQLALLLQESGFAVKPIYSPTVPEGKEGIRICIHTFNSDEAICQLASLIVSNTGV